jgi:TrmH family RNA methyltransferase
VEQNAGIQTAIFSSTLLRSDKCYEALDGLKNAGIPTTELAPDIFKSFSNRDNPSGIAAILPTPVSPLPTHLSSAQPLYVALHNPSDPGNAGTILRTMDATAAHGLILVGDSTDPTHPAAVKASMGAIFTVPIHHTPTLANLLVWAKTHQLQTVATTAKANHSFRNLSLNSGTLLLMGSERHGLPPEILAQTDTTITIPMHGTVTSLNVAIATALILYQLTNP